MWQVTVGHLALKGHVEGKSLRGKQRMPYLTRLRKIFNGAGIRKGKKNINLIKIDKEQEVVISYDC